MPPSAVPQYQRDIYGNVKDRGPGPHVLTGPVEIKGAEPGDVLEVAIERIVPDSLGYTGTWPHMQPD